MSKNLATAPYIIFCVISRVRTLWNTNRYNGDNTGSPATLHCEHTRNVILTVAPNLQNASLLFKINLLISLHHNQKGYIFIVLYSDRQCVCVCGPGSSVGIATDYRLDGPGSNPGGTRFSVRPDRPWGPPSLLYNEYRVFPGGKVRPGRAADHSPPSSAAVMEEYSYTSTHSLGLDGNTLTLYIYGIKVKHKYYKHNLCHVAHLGCSA